MTAISRSARKNDACARAAALLLLLAAPLRGIAAEDDALLIERGAYLVRAGGCVACHTDGERGGGALAGGGPIKTSFGTFYAPNITPDRARGLGGWSEADFVAAMTRGRAPDGSPYYPIFHYTTYTRITPDDLHAIWTYLNSVAPDDTARRDHQLGMPFRYRWLNRLWQLLYFRAESFIADPGKSARWNRGSYLVESLSHCRECHTPRTAFGGLDLSRAYAGVAAGPDGRTVPNITSDAKTGIGGWSESDITWLLKTGFLPDGDVVEGTMAELVEHGTKHLSDDDRAAIATYIKSLPAIANRIGKPKSGNGFDY